MSNTHIGDTPEQIGTIEAADAIMIDGKIVTRGDVRRLQSERDALASTVVVLSSKLKEVAALVDGDGFSAVQWILDNYADVGQLANKTPEQHLAELRAEAVRDFILWGTLEMDPEFAEFKDSAETYIVQIVLKHTSYRWAMKKRTPRA